MKITIPPVMEQLLTARASSIGMSPQDAIRMLVAQWVGGRGSLQGTRGVPVGYLQGDPMISEGQIQGPSRVPPGSLQGPSGEHAGGVDQVVAGGKGGCTTPSLGTPPPEEETEEEAVQEEEKETTSLARPAKRRGRKNPSGPAEFLAWYAAYPRKIAPKKALAAWLKLGEERPPLDRLLAKLTEQCASDQWRRDDGAYIPYPASYLNGWRWEDETTIQLPRQRSPYDSPPKPPEAPYYAIRDRCLALVANRPIEERREHDLATARIIRGGSSDWSVICDELRAYESSLRDSLSASPTLPFIAPPAPGASVH